MDIQPTEQKVQALSDDQELAKVLAGVDNDSSDDQVEVATPTVPTPATPMPDAPAPADDTASDDSASDDDSVADQPTEPQPETPTLDPIADFNPAPEVQAPTLAPADDLESIKQEALGELRPLVDKLNVSPEEKFDTYLLLLRSTDDRELIAPAHEAAKGIADESRKAQALLDIIKEIDFLSGNSQQPQA